MKKRTIKIFAIFMLTAIFPMAGGFCFQNVLNPVKIAQAAANEIKINHDNDSSDSCEHSENYSSFSSNKLGGYQNVYVNAPLKAINIPTPLSNGHHGVLPCCTDGNHPESISNNQSFELSKSIAIFVTPIETIPLVKSEKLSYNSPLTAPPELEAVKKTVLRL